MTSTTLCPVLAEPELRSLLLAASHAPECDTTRGAIADWLEENAGTEECGVCKGRGKFTKRCRPAPPHKRNRQTDCSTCSGSGHVPDLAGQWSELIRVGVELAGYADGNTRMLDSLRRSGLTAGGKERFPGLAEMLRRYSTLLSAVETRLRRVTQCRKCGGQWNPYSADDRCDDCDGTGYTGVLNARQYNPALFAHDLLWQRGLPYRVDATIAGWWDSDTDQPSKFARRVVEWMPCLTELWATDREPHSSRGFGSGPLQGKDSFDWRDSDDPWGDESCGLPAKLLKEVGKEADYYCPGGGLAEFASTDLARSALGRALRRLSGPAATTR